jgi:hypothetical protein
MFLILLVLAAFPSTAVADNGIKGQRAILNLTPGPIGVNLASRGDICLLRGMFTPSFTPRSEHSLLFT